MRLKRWQWVLLSIAVVLWVAKIALLDGAAAPGPAYTIDLEGLHRAALSGGALPSRIEVEQLAEFGFPRTIVVAGDGFGMHKMVLLSHRVVFSDHTLIIDTAIGPKAGGSLPGAKLDTAALARMQKAMLKSDAILFTHEHVDHVGGVAEAPSFNAIASKVVMTKAQFNGPKLERKFFPPGGLDQLKLLEYSGLHAVAPGVVLQMAPGHTPGTQLIYVELANGARYLFVGDIAWTEDNIRLQRGRPGIATMLMSEDRPAVAAQLNALAALPKDVHIVVAHDPVAYKRDLARGLFQNGFSE